MAKYIDIEYLVRQAEAAVAHLTAADPTDTVQYEAVRSSRPRSPERRLTLTILQDAVDVFLKYAKPRSLREQRLFNDAAAYIFDGQDGDWPLSFENLCAAFELSPDYIRRGLAKYKREVDGDGEPRKTRHFRLRDNVRSHRSRLQVARRRTH